MILAHLGSVRSKWSFSFLMSMFSSSVPGGLHSEPHRDTSAQSRDFRGQGDRCDHGCMACATRTACRGGRTWPWAAWCPAGAAPPSFSCPARFRVDMSVAVPKDGRRQDRAAAAYLVEQALGRPEHGLRSFLARGLSQRGEAHHRDQCEENARASRRHRSNLATRRNRRVVAASPPQALWDKDEVRAACEANDLSQWLTRIVWTPRGF